MSSQGAVVGCGPDCAPTFVCVHMWTSQGGLSGTVLCLQYFPIARSPFVQWFSENATVTELLMALNMRGVNYFIMNREDLYLQAWFSGLLGH